MATQRWRKKKSSQISALKFWLIKRIQRSKHGTKRSKALSRQHLIQIIFLMRFQWEDTWILWASQSSFCRSLVSPHRDVELAKISLLWNHVLRLREKQTNLPVFAKTYLEPSSKSETGFPVAFAGVRHCVIKPSRYSISSGVRQLCLSRLWKLFVWNSHLPPLVIWLVIHIAARYDLSWKKCYTKGLSWQKFNFSMVLPHVSHSLSYCDGSLSIAFTLLLALSSLAFGLLVFLKQVWWRKFSWLW